MNQHFFPLSRTPSAPGPCLCPKSIALFFMLALFAVGHARAQIDWPTISLSPVGTNAFTHPTVITHAGDNSGRVFICEQPGQVWIAQSNTILPLVFLDIRGRVLSAGAEQGLLGLAFPPAYAGKGHFYVDYTRSPDGFVVISRFGLTADPNVADTNSEQVLLVIPKPYNNHNGGQLAFGPDGFLYIGVGDGGSEGDPLNNGQTTTNLLGKLLRIDVESGAVPYLIPPGNPFVGNTNFAPEIWSYGLRNPWRFSFDRASGDLFIADVGQNMYEEIDFQQAGSAGGQNYGWRIMEGFAQYNVPSGFTNFQSLTPPMLVYSHQSLPTDLSGAVIGGYAYRGPSQPRMDGIYFYADFIVGWIWGLKLSAGIPQTNLLGSAGPGISTFGEDDQGQLYVANYYNGRIYQISDSGQVWAPAFSAASGVINSNQIVVSCVTPNAEIHFTTNGVDPTTADPVVAAGATIHVATGFTNKARAFRADLGPSVVTSAIYTNKVGALSFSPPGGPVTNGTRVEITTSTPGAALYYTTNGTAPGTNSLVYASPLLLQQSSTLKAIGVASGFLNSDLKSASYSIPQTAFPVFTPPAGRVPFATPVSMACATPGAGIFYTTDGTLPSTSSLVYTSAIPITQDVQFISFAEAPGDAESFLITNTYRLPSAPPPVFDPPAGPLTNSAKISISTGFNNAVIFYTLDGSAPTTNSAVYSGPLTFSNAFTLSASALPPELDLSAPQTVRFGRRVPESTVVTTLAGGPVDGWVDALARNARFMNPLGICMDASGNLFVADNGNNVVRRISSSGEVTTYAGSGIAGYQAGQSTNAQFTAPVGICVDATGNVFVFNSDACDDISEIDTNLNVTAYKNVGAVLGICADVPSPGYMAVNTAGTIYFGVKGEAQELTSAGNMLTLTDPALIFHGFSFHIGPAPDPANNLYIATEYKIWKRTSKGVLSLFAGSASGYSDAMATNAWFQGPQDVVVDAYTNIFVTDGSSIRKVHPDGSVTTLAGTGSPGYVNGPGAVAQFSGAAGICMDTNGNVFVADSGNNCIREISPDTAGIGIPDWWQLAHFGIIGIDPNADPDHDGMSNYQEFWAGTDPLDPSSVLKIDAKSLNSAGDVQISWQTSPGKTYSVEYSNDLNSWTALGNPVTGDGTPAVVIDPAPIPQYPHRYYRINLVGF